ncbi:MAG: hypothetical protein EXR48_04365 [Dehalococcoidia bacterium]|nr:hypothetical protein [Dehalococcoidia bacterium]
MPARQMRQATRRSLAPGALLLLLAGLLAFWPEAPAHAQQTANLSGRVVNGTANAPVPPGLHLRLVAQVGETLLHEQETTPAPDGAYTFTNVPLEPTALYFVTTEHQGAEYTVRVDPAQAEASWRLTVYEATSDGANIRATENTLFIPSTRNNRRLLALELVRLENTGDRTLVPDLSQANPMGLLRFSLPPNANDLDVQSTLRGGNVVPVDKGFALTVPLPPGSYDVLFSYTIPYSGGALAFTRTFPFGAVAFELLVAEAVGEVSSPGLEPASRILIDDKGYSRLAAQDIPANGRLDLSFSNLPRPSLLRRIIDPFQGGTVARVGIPLLAALVLAALLALAITRRRRERALRLAPEASGETRQELVAALAELDDRFASALLQEREYQERRAALLERIRQAGAPPRTPPETTQGAG